MSRTRSSSCSLGFAWSRYRASPLGRVTRTTGVVRRVWEKSATAALRSATQLLADIARRIAPSPRAASGRSGGGGIRTLEGLPPNGFQDTGRWLVHADFGPCAPGCAPSALGSGYADVAAAR